MIYFLCALTFFFVRVGDVNGFIVTFVGSLKFFTIYVSYEVISN